MASQQIKAYRKANRMAAVAFTTVLFITQGISFLLYQSQKSNEQLQVSQETEHIKNQLISALNHSVATTKTLAFLVEKDLLGDYFDIISEELLGESQFIDAVQLVHGETILKTYPLEGNEVTIGYPILTNDRHAREAEIARNRGEIYYEGPIELIQGGRGFIGRHPIFKDSEFWGYAAVIIHLETFVEAIGMDSTGRNETYSYQIVKKRESTTPSDYVFSDFNDLHSGIVAKDFVEEGDWYIYARLNNPLHFRKTVPFAVLGLVLAFLFGFFVRFIAMQPLKLQVLVEEKTRDLEESNRRLELKTRELSTTNDDLEQFAYVASHDLQEPLRMISSFMSQLKKRYGAQLDEAANQYMFFAIDGATRMRQIILDLLEFSKLGKTASEKQEIDINEMVNEYINLRQSLIEEKKAQIYFGQLPVIFSHQAAVKQLFHNLIDNALKYTRAGSAPEINIKGSDNGSHWKFSISDNGIGIEPEYHKKIFVIFQRLHSDKNMGGTGLGLAIVKKVIDLLDGEIDLTSIPGKGTTFTFTIKK